MKKVFAPAGRGTGSTSGLACLKVVALIALLPVDEPSQQGNVSLGQVLDRQPLRRKRAFEEHQIRTTLACVITIHLCPLAGERGAFESIRVLARRERSLLAWRSARSGTSPHRGAVPTGTDGASASGPLSCDRPGWLPVQRRFEGSKNEESFSCRCEVRHGAWADPLIVSNICTDLSRAPTLTTTG